MYDVGTKFTGCFSKKRPIRVIAVITLWSFLFTAGVGNAPVDTTWAVSIPEERSNVRSFAANSPSFQEIDVKSFELPYYLGQVTDRYVGRPP